MTRLRRISTALAVALVLLLLAGGAGVLTVRSDWFREQVRQRIVAEVSRAVNGKVETGAFRFHWSQLTAELDDLTVHGTEAAGERPLLSVKRITVGLRIISLWEKTFDLARVEAVEPRVNLILGADGSSNVPPPHRFQPQTVLDLKVGHFLVTNGSVTIAGARRPPKVIGLLVRGENLAAESRFVGRERGYESSVSVGALHLEPGSGFFGPGSIDTELAAQFRFARDVIAVTSATVRTKSSELRLRDVEVAGFEAPVISGAYHARIALEEADRIFRLRNFQHTGMLDLAGRGRFVSVSDYEVNGAAYGFGIGYGKLRDLSATTNFKLTPAALKLTGMIAKVLDGVVSGNGGVAGGDRFQVEGTFEHFAANRTAEALEISPFPWDGLLSGTFHSTGTLSEADFHSLQIEGTADVAALETGVPVHGQLSARYDARANTLDLGPSWLVLAHSRADFSGRVGERLAVRLESKDLNELRPAVTLPAQVPGGDIRVSGTVEGSVNTLHLNGHAEGKNVVWEGEKFDSAAVEFDATSSALKLRAGTIIWNGTRIDGGGAVALTQWAANDNSAVTADIEVKNGALKPLAALAGAGELPVSGTLTVEAKITGTLGTPRVGADLTLAKGQIYGEPFDSATGHAQYLNSGTQSFTGTVTAGAKRLAITAGFDHAAGSALAGTLHFTVAGNAIPLDQISLVRGRVPDIRGVFNLKAEGSAVLEKDRFHLAGLTGDVKATGLGAGTRSLGDAQLSASTAGNVVSLTLDSQAAQAAIHGEGTVGLSGDFPARARVTFSRVTLDGVRRALYAESARKGPANEGELEGELAGEALITGPAGDPAALSAVININSFELGQHRSKPASPDLRLRNDGPLRLRFARSVFTVESARITGLETRLEIGGRVSPSEAAPLDLRVGGNVDLGIVRTLGEEISATGTVSVNATVRGTFSQPDVSGRADLRGGEFRYADFANTLTNTNGTILFSGNRATIQNLTAETGGGKVGISGFASVVNGLPAFRLEARGRQIRVRYPEGISSVSDSDLTLTGTPERSDVAGKVTIRRVSINPKSDAASLLARSVEPLRTPAARTGPASGLNLDIQIETAPDVAFETSVARSLQADASLRLRGTAASPALLGRVNISQGEIVAFGNKYTINQGSVSFFNPAKIDPILNIDLETRSRGVDVVLTISGPVSKLNVGYRSDPPLQFGDIVALLATGRTPGNNTVAAGSGSQAFQQLGASTLVGQAITAPAPGRLERFFGVSRIKIDPQLSGLSGTPQARLTVEQQITPDILFTYVSNVTNTNSQLIRVEWTFDRNWGAILTREANGYIGLDFAYRKRFK